MDTERLNIMRLQDKAELAMRQIDRLHANLEARWNEGNLVGCHASLKLIRKAVDTIEEVIKQQLYDNLGV